MSNPRVYYRLFDDMSTSKRWYLSAPTGPGGEWLSTALTRAEPYEGQVPLHVAVYQPGPELELTVPGNAVLVVNQRVARIIESVAAADVQLLPAQVDGSTGPHFVVNVLRMPDCIDEQRSADARRYTAEDGRPDRIGQFKAVGGMKIDPARAGGHHLLRPWGWHVVLVVSDTLADALRSAGVRCQITPVT